jgi:thioredoxin-related protein
MLNTVFKLSLLFLLVASFAQAREIDLNSMVKKASKTQNHLFVFLHQTDCGYCESMIQFTFEDEKIKSFINNNFIYEHINIKEKDVVSYKEFKGSGKEFAKYIGYDFYPTSLFFDNRGELVFVEVGYIDKESIPNETRFYKILEHVKSKKYKEMNFNVSK